MLRKYHLYAAFISAAAVVIMAGCASRTQAASIRPSAGQETQEETTAENTVVETVSAPVESVGQEESQTLLPVRIYGPAMKLENGTLSIDNQSGESSSGEIILNISQENTRIIDAQSGLPVSFDELKDGSVIYAYIGPAMTMSLPPMTNAELIIANNLVDTKAPDYVEVKSVVTDANTSQSILTAADGTQYQLAEDCQIYPYLTRNIVTLNDLTQGSTCVIWSDADNRAVQIMVFGE